MSADSSPERANEFRPTPSQPDSLEDRLRRSIEFISLEDDLGFTDETIFRFAHSLLSRGLTIRPLVNRW
jgi:hypothetical protein